MIDLAEVIVQIRSLATHTTGPRNTKLLALADTLETGDTTGAHELLIAASTWDTAITDRALKLAEVFEEKEDPSAAELDEIVAEPPVQDYNLPA